MDPALAELLREEETAGDRVVEAIIRLREPGAPVPEVDFVARFGRIATCRLPLGAVRAARAHPDVVSLKAPRLLGPEPSDPALGSAPAQPADVRRPAGLP